jgi:hypothetical protein
MTLLVYAARRTIGAVGVFLIVVMLTMLAVARSAAGGWRPHFESDYADVHAMQLFSTAWSDFPLGAVGTLGLLAAVVAVRRRLSR